MKLCLFYLQVTMALLEQGEFITVSQINNALVGAGYLKESADIAGKVSRQIYFSSPEILLTHQYSLQALAALALSQHLVIQGMSVRLLAGVMGSQMSNNFLTSLKEAGANLLPDIWPNKTSNKTSPASSTTESISGLDDLAVDSKKSVLQSLKDGEFGFSRED